MCHGRGAGIASPEAQPLSPRNDVVTADEKSCDNRIFFSNPLIIKKLSV